MPRKYALGKRAAQQADTRGRIIAAALELYQEQGVSATTMLDIARRADVAPGTVANHFGSAAALATEIAAEILSELRMPTPDLFVGIDGLRDRVDLLVRELSAFFASEDRPERLTDQGYLRRLNQCRDVTASRVDELLAAQQARSIVEERYLDGNAALFPDAVRDVGERLLLAQELAVMADRFAELDGLDPAMPISPDAIPARAAALVADLVEPSRATTLDKLDEGGRALTIATDWLRSKKASLPVGTEDLVPEATTP